MQRELTSYLDDTEIQENDYVFYSEYNGKNTKLRYADALCQIVRYEGELCIQTLVHRNHMKKFTTINDKPISLKYVSKENIMLIEDYNEDLAPVVFMNKHYFGLQQAFRKKNLPNVKFFATK
jgi:hypothetical protein